MTKRRLIGYATTDSSGVASLTYTGVGVGEMDIVAESGGEMLFHYIGTGGTETDTWIAQTSAYAVSTSTSSTGTTFTSTGSSSGWIWANKQGVTPSTSTGVWTGDFTIELDVVSKTGTVSLMIYESSGTGSQSQSVGMSNGHWKIARNGNVFTIDHDGTTTTATKTLTEPLRIGFSIETGKAITFKNFFIYRGSSSLVSEIYEVLDCSYYETIPNGVLRQGTVTHQNIGKSSVAISDEWSTIGNYSIKVTSTDWGWGGYIINNPVISKKGTIKLDCKNTGNVGYYAYISIGGSQYSVNVNKTTDFEGTVQVDYDFSNIDGEVTSISIRGVSRASAQATIYLDNIRIYPI